MTNNGGSVYRFSMDFGRKYSLILFERENVTNNDGFVYRFSMDFGPTLQMIKRKAQHRKQKENEPNTNSNERKESHNS